ncbi:MAG: hypothetical protein WAQ98_11005 [Blastocatellia bacterium]|jgi:hypothetical protein
MAEKTNNWNEYERLVMYRLDQLDERLQQQQEQLQKLQIELQQVSLEIHAFKKSAGLVGAIGGFLVSVIFFIIDKLWKG